MSLAPPSSTGSASKRQVRLFLIYDALHQAPEWAAQITLVIFYLSSVFKTRL